MALPKTQEEEEKRMDFLAANSHYFLPHHAVHPGCTMQCPVCAWFQHAKQLILVTALTHQPEERQTTQALLTSRYSPPAGATSGDGAVLEQALVDNPELSEEAASTTPWQGLLETHGRMLPSHFHQGMVICSHPPACKHHLSLFHVHKYKQFSALQRF